MSVELAKIFIFTLLGVTTLLAAGTCVLLIPYMFIAITFGIGWGIAYLLMAIAVAITISESARS